MLSFGILPNLQKILNKLSKKDALVYRQVLKKIEEVISSPDVEHYKNLRYDMKDKKRIHVWHFVLVFKFVKEEGRVEFLDFDHHDNIYGRSG